MKKLIIVIICIIFPVQIIYSQIEDLESLASGSLSAFWPVFDQDSSLYGYLTLFKFDENDTKEEDLFEYVLLDPKLEKFANGTMSIPEYGSVKYKFYNIEKIGNSLILSIKYAHKKNEKLEFTDHYLLNTTDNKIKGPFHFDESTILFEKRSQDNIRKELKGTDWVNYLLPYDDKFFVISNNKTNHFDNDVSLIQGYDDDLNKLWNADIRPDEKKNDKKYRQNFKFANTDYIVFEEWDKKENNWKILNAKTGELLSSINFQNKDSKYSYDYEVKVIDDEIIFAGRLSEYSRSGFTRTKELGFFKKVYSPNGKLTNDHKILWSEIDGGKISVSKNGNFKNGFDSQNGSVRILNNGQVTFFAEKVKYDYFSSTKSRFKGLVVLLFSTDMELLDALDDDQKSQDYFGTPYRFNQTTGNGDGVIFFYKNFEKQGLLKFDPKLEIFKVADNKILKDEIALVTQYGNAQPFVAKEGYILLASYDKKSKRSKILLEKLN